MYFDSKFLVLFLSYFVISDAHTGPAFYFSTAEKNFPLLLIQPESLLSERYAFNQNTKVYVIIHGWLQNGHEPYIKNIIKLKSRDLGGNAAFIIVDWSFISRMEYEQAQEFNSVVAKAISSLLNSILISSKLRQENIEVISYCMGCHIAGMACRNVCNSSGKKIGRITALDPSGPGYYCSSCSERLDSNDAQVVFVVHTDAFMFGLGDHCGTIDFYPNGGRFPQPGCSNFTGIITHNLCSHQRSLELYLESLNDPVFCGVKCPSYKEYTMGLCSANKKVNFAMPLRKEQRGLYFYATNSRRPFLRKK